MSRLFSGFGRARFPALILVATFLVAGQSPLHAERTIHVFSVFCNAYQGHGGKINEGVTADRVILDNIFKSYFSEQSWGVKLRRLSIEGDLAVRDNVVGQFNNFIQAIGPEDTLYVHFSGHGVILDPTSGEQFLQLVDEELVSRLEWADQIARLPCQLKIMITDCCSTYPDEFTVAEGDDKVEPWKNLYSLLLEHRGFVNITAASPGQPAYGSEYGGFLTINLESDMQRFSKWEDVFRSTQARVKEETAAQLRALGVTDAPDQEPFAYSLGVYERSADRPSSIEYVIPDSNRRLLTREELDRMGLKQLYLARNEIFARYGYDFSSPFLQDYFGSLSWYRLQPGMKSPPVSDLETTNANLILRVEKDWGGPFIAGNRVMPGDGAGDAPPDIFVYSSDQSLSRSVLQNLTPQELSIARNEIYARHGYPFSSPALQDYFGRKPYYQRSNFSGEPNFNAIEKHNIWLIRKIERINGGAYTW